MTSVYVFAYDETIQPIEMNGDPSAVRFAAAWRLWLVDDIGSVAPEASQVSGVDPFAGELTSFQVGDSTFATAVAADLSATDLLDVTDPEAIAVASTQPFIVTNAVGLR